MKCDNVKSLLPEYLAGTLDKNKAAEIAEHIENCKSCKKEADDITSEITAPILNEDGDIKRILKNTKRKFNMNIIRKITAVTIALALLVYMIPYVLGGVQFIKIGKASRALMDIIQFSQPAKVIMWGNRNTDRSSMSIPLLSATRLQIGKGYGEEQKDIVANLSVLTGKVTVPLDFGAQFIHPQTGMEGYLGRNNNPEVQKSILEKNADTTVALVDYSLNGIINLSDVSVLLEKYDIKICWMAVEAGVEDFKPKNMLGANQVLQWGIPGKLSRPGDMDYASIEDDIDKYESLIIEEMSWLDENKDILAPYPDLLKNNGINNSVEDKAAYVIENGIKIYGVRITGPSDELLRLTENLDIRTMTVVEMDFWNW